MDLCSFVIEYRLTKWSYYRLLFSFLWYRCVFWSFWKHCLIQILILLFLIDLSISQLTWTGQITTLTTDRRHPAGWSIVTGFQLWTRRLESKARASLKPWSCRGDWALEEASTPLARVCPLQCLGLIQLQITRLCSLLWRKCGPLIYHDVLSYLNPTYINYFPTKCVQNRPFYPTFFNLRFCNFVYPCYRGLSYSLIRSRYSLFLFSFPGVIGFSTFLLPSFKTMHIFISYPVPNIHSIGGFSTY